MAQRTVHYVFGQILAERCGIDDMPRFLFGSLLPDAIPTKEERYASHYMFHSADGTRYYEFDRFFRDFADRMDDPLYIGYYMHLVEDSYYRDFYHRKYHLYFVDEEKVRKVHRDYHLLNPYLREKYAIVPQLSIPAGYDDEPLVRAAPFDAKKLLRDFETDMTEQPEGSFRFFTPAMMDEFIACSLPPCERELRALLCGGELMRSADFAWNINDQ